MAAPPTLRQLEYLVALAEQRSFQRAARACHVSQPGLSAQVKQLEHLLGVRLFERDTRRVLITPAGQEILRRARSVLAEVRGIEEAAQALQRPLCGTLRIGVIPTIAPYLLPRVLPRVRRRWPDLQLRLHEGLTRDLVALLRRGELDLLLVALGDELAGLETRALFDDPFAVALPVDHRLSRRRRLRESDLAGEELMLLEDGHCLRDQALAVCGAAHARERTDFRASSLATLLEMVCGGGGITLLPELAVAAEARRREIVLVPFQSPAPARTVGMAWRPSSGRAAEFALLAELLVPPPQRARGA